MRNWYETPLGQTALTQQTKIVTVPAPRRSRASRVYSSARSSRLLPGAGGSNTSADAELLTSILNLRSRSRQLIRDQSYAKRARGLVVNNVIGPGIGVQAKVGTMRGPLNQRVNDGIEAAWARWTRKDTCHIGESLTFADIERLAMFEIFDAGEVIIRKHTRADGQLTLEVIEGERIADDYQALSPQSPGSTIRLGVELNGYYKPIAYWLRERHPGEIRWVGHDSDRVFRVPAEEIFHLRIITRWPQTRGEPWMHTAIRRLLDIEGYSEAEAIRARAQATRMGIIETPQDVDDLDTRTQEEKDADANGDPLFHMEPGIIGKLSPGEKWIDSAPSAPNPQLDPFMRYMIREICVGIGVSYASGSGDYSQTNYSSSRLALLDDRDAWRALQLWFIRSFREELHRAWLAKAMLARSIPEIDSQQYWSEPSKFEQVLFKPRGWSWIDPTKEVAAYKEAIAGGLTTVTDVIAQTAAGRDIEEILDERKAELEMMDKRGLVFDTSPAVYIAKNAPAEKKAEPASNEDDDAKDDAKDAKTSDDEKPERSVIINNYVTPPDIKIPVRIENPIRLEPTVVNVPASIVHVAAPNVTVQNDVRSPDVRVEVPAAPDVHVTIEPTPITMQPPAIHVDVQPTPIRVAPAAVNVEVSPTPVTVSPAAVQVDVAAPTVNVAAPDVRIAPAEVTVINELPEYEVTEQKPVRDGDGRIEKIVTTKKRSRRR